ncbi:hypothetical protein K438DRAFT_1840325 [Mycena galopus ATCC 62051]|nr:hypothetical protein K438DRAFT_1840325 [Mycena galopus ATCC 62051]
MSHPLGRCSSNVDADLAHDSSVVSEDTHRSSDYSYHDQHTHGTRNGRREGYRLTRYREAFRLPPKPSSYGGTFFAANNVNNTAENIIQNHGETGINILHHAVALEALYDSADSFPQPRCHPETRIKLLDDLHQWAFQNGSAQSILWLHGPAGAGKSAVMQTLCQRLRSDGCLGGAFFFKRGHATRGNAKMLFATLAYQLALNSRELNSLISRNVLRDPSVVGRDMNAQLRQLIVEPCKSLGGPAAPALLVDGLDECDTHHAQVEILRLIGSVTHQHPGTFRFLIASRPEAHIRGILEQPFFARTLDSVNIERSFDDVRKYLRDEFARIHREHRHTVKGVQTTWPSPDILDGLVSKSSGYFVYASTIVKFVDDKYFRPTDRLAAVTDLSQTHLEAPFAPLDQLYIHILSGVPAQFRSTLDDILQCVVSVDLGLHLNPHELDELLGLKPGDVDLTLRGLHSVIDVSLQWSDGICAYHASFVDFLQDPRRSSIFHTKPENHMNLTCGILKNLSGDSDQGNALQLDCNLPAYLTSVPPSAELVPLISNFNPDFLFYYPGDFWGSDLTDVLLWLKAIQLVPEDLIQAWEGYRSMYSWDSLYRHMAECTLPIHSLSPSALRVLRARNCSFSQVPLEACRELVVQSPEFVRIFQATWALQIHFHCPGETLYYTRLLLDIPWDSIVVAFSALSSIVALGRGTEKEGPACTLAIVFTLSAELHPSGLAAVTSDLARGFIRVIQRVVTGDLALHLYDHLLCSAWGQLVRSSPHSSAELLQDLHEFVPPWEEFPLKYPWHYCLCIELHDVIQWLQQLPDPPLRLIERWKIYLLGTERICQCPLELATYDIRWQKHRERWQEFPVPSDEEMVTEWWDLKTVELF